MRSEAARNSANQNHSRIVGVHNDGSFHRVAVLGAIGDWAAYQLPAEKLQTVEWLEGDTKAEVMNQYVARQGNQMYAKHAFEVFFWLDPAQWRP